MRSPNADNGTEKKRLNIFTGNRCAILAANGTTLLFSYLGNQIRNIVLC